jgi:hypothetical protein
MGSAYDNLNADFVKESEVRFQNGLSQVQIINALGEEFSVHVSLLDYVVPAVDSVRNNLGNNITTIFSSIPSQSRINLGSNFVNQLFKFYGLVVITPSNVQLPTTTVDLTPTEVAEFGAYILPADFGTAITQMITIIQSRYDSNVSRPMVLGDIMAIGNKTMELPSGHLSAAKFIAIQAVNALVCHGTVISAPNIAVTLDPVNIFGCTFNYTNFFKSTSDLTALQQDFAEIIEREALGVAEQVLISSVGAFTFS